MPGLFCIAWLKRSIQAANNANEGQIKIYTNYKLSIFDGFVIDHWAFDGLVFGTEIYKYLLRQIGLITESNAKRILVSWGWIDFVDEKIEFYLRSDKTNGYLKGLSSASYSL